MMNTLDSNMRRMAGLLARGEIILMDTPPPAAYTLTNTDTDCTGNDPVAIDYTVALERPREPWRRGRPLR